MRFRMQWVEKAGRGGRNTTGNGLDVVTYHTLSDYENEISPVVHFMLDRLQIGLHFWNWSTWILQKFRSLDTSIYYMVWHESRETFNTTMPHILSDNEMGEVTNSLKITSASLNFTLFPWLHSWLRKVIRLLYSLLCRAALYTCKVSIATL